MKFEPWHIRYVGEELANYLYSNGLTLEEYYKEKSEDSGDEFFAVSYKGADCGWYYLFTGNAREFICFVGGFELSLRNKDLCIFLRHYRN